MIKPTSEASLCLTPIENHTPPLRNSDPHRNSAEPPITMLPQRIATRGAARFGAQMRATAQRRMNSSADNAFVKERTHTKEHATGTTGELAPAVRGGYGGRDKC